MMWKWNTLELNPSSQLPVQRHNHYTNNETVIVDNVQNDLSPQLIESAEKAADLDPRVLDAYIHQCTAEAQEGSLFSPLSTCLSYIRQELMTFLYRSIFDNHSVGLALSIAVLM